MIRWAHRRCGNCGYWQDAKTGCTRTWVALEEAPTKATMVCGEHRTETEIDDEIAVRAVAGYHARTSLAAVQEVERAVRAGATAGGDAAA